METVGIVVMVVMMGVMLLFGHKFMMGGHGGHGDDSKARPDIAATTNNAPTNALTPSAAGHTGH
ncbi:MAG: hypothetical protein HYV35_12555 [Lentisphaerae bacterium]|nr:hypothetical protein [Lentisphaerota bacterium]